MPLWLGLLLGVPALLVCAKAHGRQVRLEREAAGYHSVVFGGENPAFVDTLWARDRRRFWTFVPLAAIALGSLAWIAWTDVWRALVAALLWAPTAGFLFAGLWAYAARRGEGGPWWWVAALGSAMIGVAGALV